MAALAPAPPPAELTPPFVHVPGLPNFRDLGGYPVTAAAATTTTQPPQRMFRRGLVFRASEPSRLTDDGVARLQQLGIARVYDLRSHGELEPRDGRVHARVRQWAGAERVFCPVFTDEDYSPEAIARRWGQFSEGDAGFVLAYERILHVGAQADHPHAPFRSILAHLAGDDPVPVLIHCSAGKDRTGVICALLLSLAGADDDVVAHEYNLTEVGLAHRRQEFVDALVSDGPLKGRRDKAERMVSASKEAMRGTLDMLRAKYGSTERYVLEHCGMSPESLAKLRSNLIVDVGSDGEQPLDWMKHAEYVASLSKSK